LVDYPYSLEFGRDGVRRERREYKERVKIIFSGKIK
jgi:hypothetical protein